MFTILFWIPGYSLSESRVVTYWLAHILVRGKDIANRSAQSVIMVF